MSETTFYWHDYETYGLERWLDRPVQFAGQRTTLDFKHLGKNDVWYCDCAPDYLPNPEACLVTGLTPQAVHEKGALCEAKFAEKINKVFCEPNTVSIGYNSNAFDDEITRHLFWRNLIEPYEREFRNGCSRWDLLPVVRAVWALRPEGIVWPEVEDEQGRRVSFRLEHLSAANGLEHRHAHDAMSDVEATIGLARLIAERQPRFWQWAFENRTKEKVNAALFSGMPSVWIDSSIGQKLGYIRIVLPICLNPKYPKEAIVWDCREDPEVLRTLTPETIRHLAWEGRKVLAEDELPLALKRMKMNAAPFVCSNLKVLNAAVCERFSIDLEAVLANARKLAAICSELVGPITLSLERKDESEPHDADCALYDGLVDKSCREVLSRVRSSTPESLAELVGEGRVHFSDERLEELLWRMRARNWPQTLTETESLRWKAFCAARLKGIVAGTLSLTEYFNRIDALVEENDESLDAGRIDEAHFESRQAVLEALYNWGEYVGEFSSVEA